MDDMLFMFYLFILGGVVDGIVCDEIYIYTYTYFSIYPGCIRVIRNSWFIFLEVPTSTDLHSIFPLKIQGEIHVYITRWNMIGSIYIYIHIGTAINQGIEMQIGGYTMLCNIPWCSTPSIIILCIMCTYIYMPICSGLRMYNIYTQNHPTADGWNRVKPWEGDGMTISVLFCGLWHVMNPIQSWYFSNCN